MGKALLLSVFILFSQDNRIYPLEGIIIQNEYHKIKHGSLSTFGDNKITYSFVCHDGVQGFYQGKVTKKSIKKGLTYVQTNEFTFVIEREIQYIHVVGDGISFSFKVHVGNYRILEGRG